MLSNPSGRIPTDNAFFFGLCLLASSLYHVILCHLSAFQPVLIRDHCCNYISIFTCQLLVSLPPLHYERIIPLPSPVHTLPSSISVFFSPLPIPPHPKPLLLPTTISTYFR
ncbi:hypothetical protein VKT23_012133 [Stygiomarasmius scandens]|uniref:Uncharacterized protein n=1 Tax=Marasmiellus scandens TaxID=2682957 RepID=A0ABR1JCI1_9AGAR